MEGVGGRTARRAELLGLARRRRLGEISRDLARTSRHLALLGDESACGAHLVRVRVGVRVTVGVRVWVRVGVRVRVRVRVRVMVRRSSSPGRRWRRGT